MFLILSFTSYLPLLLFSYFDFINFAEICSRFIRLVGGAGDIKLTKDGNTLLKEMVSFFLLKSPRSFH